MGFSTISALVVALAKLSSIVTKLESGASRIMSAEGMSTGGGVAMCTGDVGMMVVIRGEDILSLSASAARTALRYVPRSPTDLYSSVEKFMMCVCDRSVWGGDVILCCVGPSFMCFWALLLRWGIGDRSRRLTLGRVSDAPRVPRCCHSWGNPST